MGIMNRVYRDETTILFQGVRDGEVFVYKGREYIKCDLNHVAYKPVNCYCIITGNFEYLYGDALVRIVKEIV